MILFDKSKKVTEKIFTLLHKNNDIGALIILTKYDEKLKNKSILQIYNFCLNCAPSIHVPETLFYLISTSSHKEIINLSANNNQLIQMAVIRGFTKIVKFLLRFPEVDPSVNNDNALCTACRNRDIEMVRLLLADDRVNPGVAERYMRMYPSNLDFDEIYCIVNYATIKKRMAF